MTRKKKMLTEFPDVLAQWDYEKNGELDPTVLTHGSRRVAWWICEDGHSWQQKIVDRTNLKNPICQVCNSVEVLRPDWVAEWHPKKNDKLLPSELLLGSNKKVHWRCSLNPRHEWCISVNKRKGCPFCSGKRVLPEESFGAKHKDLLREWHTEKNGVLKPHDVAEFSNKKAWWKCRSCSYEWETSIQHRAKGTGCPRCAGAVLDPSKSLAKLRPEIAAEWHPTRNDGNKPADFAEFSNKDAWWQCSRYPEHEWRTKICNRSLGKGCPQCTRHTSLPELRILSEIRSIFPNAEGRAKPVKGFEADVYIEELRMALEFDGSFFHSGKEEREQRKIDAFNGEGVQIVRAREEPLPLRHENDIRFPQRDLTKSDIDRLVRKMMDLILDEESQQKCRRYLQAKGFVNDEEFRIYQSYFPDPFPNDSLAMKRPDLDCSWDYEQNDPLTPFNFTPGSQRKVWWKCKEGEDHRWFVSVANRCKSGCPYCAGSRPSAENNLEFNNPELTREWHPTYNSLSANEVLCGSDKKAWWVCTSCGYEWKTAVKTRALLKRGCPSCAGKVLTDENSLEALNPELLEQWHPSRNQDLSPSKLKPSSREKVWWVCKVNQTHEWEAVVYSRVAGNGCPHCANEKKRGPRKVPSEKSLAWLEPLLASEWHPTRNGQLQPSQVSSKSGAKVWWQCNKYPEHEWQAVICARSAGSGCPHCYRIKTSRPKHVSFERSLAYLSPEIAAQWHPILNCESNPENIAQQSNAKVWWQCKHENTHRWQRTVCDMVRGRSGCPHCRKEKSKRGR